MFFKVYFLLLFCAKQVIGLTQDYCNSDLPSGAKSTSSSIYMSNGLCMSQCQGYKFAIVQQENCWCSNKDPQDTVSVSKCDEICPGYKQENCGSGTTYYGWLKVANDYIAGSSATSFSYASDYDSSSTTSSFSEASTTSSSSSSTSSSSSELSSTTSKSSSASSETSESSTTESSSSSESSTTSSESSTSSSTSSSSSSTTTIAPSSRSSSTVTKTVDSSALSSAKSSSINQVTITSVDVTTIMPSTHTTSDANGSTMTSAAAQSVESIYKTIVVSTTVVPNNDNNNNNNKSGGKSKGFWQNKGKVAGTFVVVALVIVLLIILCLFFFFVKPRRESKKQDEFEKTYNEIIQANLRDSVENDAKVSSGTLAVNNALKGFQEFDSDVSSNVEHKNMNHAEDAPHEFIPDYDMISENEQGSGFDVYTNEDADELVPRRQSLGALKVVNMSTTTIDQVNKD